MSAPPKIFFVLGGPGVGKGTICARLVKDFGYSHFCAGDLLREVAQQRDSPLGKQVASILDKGEIVPSEITVSLLKARISTHPNPHGYLLDGFPRKMDQAIMFEEQVAEAKGIFFFDCSIESMKERLMARMKSGSTRSDDNPDVVFNRFKVNVEVCQPVVDHYRAAARCLEIDANKEVETVYQQVVKILKRLGETPLESKNESLESRL